MKLVRYCTRPGIAGALELAEDGIFFASTEKGLLFCLHNLLVSRQAEGAIYPIT
jgi:hypothetical protein